jgi:hypothetical protein
MGLREFHSRIRDKFRFSKKEFRDFTIIVLLCALILGFNDGRRVFEMQKWLINLLECLIASIIAVFLHIAVQKAVGLREGYLVEFFAWTYGLGAGLLFMLMSLGKVIILAPFGFNVEHHEGLRLGRFRYGIMYEELSKIALYGILSNIALAFILKLIFPDTALSFIRNLIKANVYLAIYSILPFPSLDGFKIFFHRRLAWAFFAAFVITLGSFILAFKSSLIILLFGICGGLFGLIIWSFMVDKNG